MIKIWGNVFCQGKAGTWSPYYSGLMTAASTLLNGSITGCQSSYSLLAILRITPETHHGLMRKYSEAGSLWFLPCTSFDPGCPEKHESPGVPSQADHWKPFMMGQSISHPHALSHRLGCCPSGAETLASLVRIWGASHFCLSWIAFHFICLFPKERQRGFARGPASHQRVLVCEESWFYKDRF